MMEKDTADILVLLLLSWTPFLKYVTWQNPLEPTCYLVVNKNLLIGSIQIQFLHFDYMFFFHFSTFQTFVKYLVGENATVKIYFSSLENKWLNIYET